MNASELLQKHEGYVVNQAVRFCKLYQNADFDDMVQEGLLGIVDAVKCLKPKPAGVTLCPQRRFFAYARVVIMRRMHTWGREHTLCVRVPTHAWYRARVHSVPIDDEEVGILVEQETVCEQAEFRILRDYVGRLPKNQREVIQAVYIKDRNEKEAAAEIGISRGVFRGRFACALRTIRRMMQNSTPTL